MTTKYPPGLAARLTWKKGDFVIFTAPVEELRHHPGGHDHDQKTHGHGHGYAALAEKARDGGFSANRFGAVPKDGCMVSPYPQFEKKIPVDRLNRAAVRRYEQDHAAVLRRPNHFLGGWRDGDTVYLDISIRAPDRRSAAALARDHHQLAYFDLKTGESVYLEAAS